MDVTLQNTISLPPISLFPLIFHFGQGAALLAGVPELYSVIEIHARIESIQAQTLPL